MKDLWHPHSLSVTTPPQGHIPGSSQSALQVDLDITMVKPPRGTTEQGDRGWHYPGPTCRAGIGVSPHCSWCLQAASSLTACPGEADPPPHSLLPLLCRAPKLGVPAALRKPWGEDPSPSSAELQRFVLSPRLSSEAFSALPKPKLILLQQLPSCAAQRQPCCLPAPSSPRGTGAKPCLQPSPRIPGDHPAPRRGCSGLGFSAAC